MRAMKTPILVVTALLLVCASVGAQTIPISRDPDKEAPKVEEKKDMYDLRFVQGPAAPASKTFTATNGSLEIPFNNKKGRLRFQKFPGGWRLDKNEDGNFDYKDGPILRSGDTITIPCTMGDRIFPYDLQLVRSFDRGTETSLQLRSTTGPAVGYITWSITLQDANINGRYDDIGVDTVAIDSPSVGLPLRPVMKIGESIISIKLKPELQVMKIAPYKGDTVAVAVVSDESCTVSRVDISGSKMGYRGSTPSRPVTLVPGEHSVIATLALKAEGAQGAQGLYGVEGGTTTIRSGQETLKLGPPFELVADVVRSKGDGLEIRNVLLVGAAGEHYWAYVVGVDRSKSVFTASFRAGNKTKKVADLRFRGRGFDKAIVIPPEDMKGKDDLALVIDYREGGLDLQAVVSVSDIPTGD